MSPETKECLRRGQCPGCDRPHNRRLVVCSRCGDAVCEKCWIGDQVAGQNVCFQCHTDAAKLEIPE